MVVATRRCALSVRCEDEPLEILPLGPIDPQALVVTRASIARLDFPERYRRKRAWYEQFADDLKRQGVSDADIDWHIDVHMNPDTDKQIGECRFVVPQP